MAELVYLDTSAVVRWASGLAGSPEPRDISGEKKLNELIASAGQLHASPITIAEFASVTHTMYRSDHGWLSGFGDEQLDLGTRKFMTLISTGEIVIRDLGVKAFEMGMAYVASASREHGRKLHAWDAIHLYEATRLSIDHGQVVNLATSDGDFAGFLEVFPEFADHVTVLDVARGDLSDERANPHVST